MEGYPGNCTRTVEGYEILSLFATFTSVLTLIMLNRNYQQIPSP